MLCVMQNTACINHIAVTWRFDGVTNLSQNRGDTGNSFLNFGQFSVPCSTLVQFGSPAFPVDQYSASLILVKLSSVSLNKQETFLFFLGRRGGGLVFCCFSALKWLSSGPGWCWRHVKKGGSVCWEDGDKGYLWHLAVRWASFAALPQSG